MIEVKHYGSGERVRTYMCTPKREIELCLANIECLLNIALLDSDDHIRELGGGYYYRCPWLACDKIVKSDYDYCPYCGQRLLFEVDSYTRRDNEDRVNRC